MKQIRAHLKNGIIEIIPCDKYEAIDGVYHFVSTTTGFTTTLNVKDVDRLEYYNLNEDLFPNKKQLLHD